MDFGHLISESFNITRKHKVLWLFGIISAIFGGASQTFNFSFNIPSGFSPSSGMMTEGKDTAFTGLDFVKFIDPNTLVLVIAVIAVIFVTIIFAAIYIQTWAYTALVSQTLSVIRGKSPTFKEGKVIGEKFFWRVFLFRLVFGLVLIPVILLLIIPPLLFFMVGQTGLAIAFGIIDLIIFVLGLIAYSVAVGILSEFGIRGMIENDLKVRESVELGWQLLRNNLGKSVLAWLVNIAIGFVAGIFFFIIIFLFLILGILLFLINPLLIVIPIIIFLITAVFVSGILNVFVSSFWSLVYTDILKGEDAARSTEAVGTAVSSSSK